MFHNRVTAVYLGLVVEIFAGKFMRYVINVDPLRLRNQIQSFRTHSNGAAALAASVGRRQLAVP